MSVTPAAAAATGAAVKDTITGAFSYDSSLIGSNGNYVFTGSSLVHTFSLKIYNPGGQQVFSDTYAGNITSFFMIAVTATSSGTTLEIEGDTLSKQFSYSHALDPTGPPAFALTLTDSANAGTSLPNSTAIKSFVSNSASLNWDPPPDLSFGADITQFTAVPEPSSLFLGGLAVLIGGVGSRVRSRSTSRT